MVRFIDIKYLENIYLYCGDLPLQRREYTGKNFIGLSLTSNNKYHILHDIRKPFDLLDSSVDIITGHIKNRTFAASITFDKIKKVYM